MRNLLTIGIFLFLLTKSNSQSYVPMPMQNCYWTVSHHAQCWWIIPGAGDSYQTYTVFPTTDTIINSTRYIKFYLSVQTSTTGFGCQSYDTRTSGYYGGVRQDTANQKIYRKPPGTGPEQLLYDFNINIGDSIKGVYGYAGWHGGYRIVKNIYYQNFNDGVCRRVFTFKYPSSTYNSGQYQINYTFYDKLIEGYGMITGFENPIGAAADNSANLQEFYGNGMFINNQQIQFATNTNTCIQYIGLVEQKYTFSFSIYPNPSTDKITIHSSDIYAQNLQFIVSDILGNTLITSSDRTIKVDHLKNGVYFIKCFNTDTRETFIQKFVKE